MPPGIFPTGRRIIMSCPAGLKKATNYYNKLEAWKAWKNMARQATLIGLSDAVLELAPSPSDSWKKIDAQTVKLARLVTGHTAAEPGPCQGEEK
jgi:hypothetical protein